MPAQSKAQQRFMGMVHAAQKGELENPSKEVEKAADSMSDADAKDYASTKHKGLPDHVKKENMESKLKEIIRQTYRESLRETINEDATELPQATIPASVKAKLQIAIDKIKDAKLSNNAKLQLVAQVVDAMDVDKNQLSTIANKIRSKMESVVKEAKYPTDLKVGSVILGQGFTRLKGVDGGKYYKIVDMDDTTATLVPSDKSGNVKGSSKVRHKLDSIEGGIKTAKRGDENGIVVIKESVNEGKFKIDDLVYNKRTKTIGIVRIGDDKYGEVKTDADGNVNVDELEKYNPIKNKHHQNAKVAPSTEREVNNRGLFNPFKNESVNEGKKVFKVNPGIGSSKYSISSHDGVKTHKDGSDFYDIKIFKNKVDLENGIKDFKSKGFIEESVIKESVSHEAMGIASMTNTRKEAVQKFIDDNNLDAQEILKVVTKGGLVERVRFIQALVGTPGNSSFKWYVKTYANESVNEASLSWKDVDKYANAISNLTQIDTKDVKKFIEDNKLNIEKIFAIAHKTSQGKTDFVKAIKAAPNSSIQNAYIKTYANEGVVKESDEPSDIIKDLDKLRNDLIKKVEVLIAKKKKLYSNVDITTPMSVDEKQLDKDIQSIFSEIQSIIQQKRKIQKESINETFVKGKTYGGTKCEGGCFIGKAGLEKIIKISKESPEKTFMFRDDNYSGLQPHFIKDGVIAKATVLNPAYDFEKHKVNNLKIDKDVILSVRWFV